PAKGRDRPPEKWGYYRQLWPLRLLQVSGTSQLFPRAAGGVVQFYRGYWYRSNIAKIAHLMTECLKCTRQSCITVSMRAHQASMAPFSTIDQSAN
ncbi:MAG: hypothetical protein P8M25_11050, partial [Paracoccaceae bacterium]|nr:hypothetical protein [Paracoccaceae bacterium]